MENRSSTPEETTAGSPGEVIVRARDLGKCYRIFDNPKDRLKQAIFKERRQYFREFWALRHIDFELRRGETLGIIGRNGSGKSTLLQLLCGTLTPTEGESSTHGRLAALLELGSGFNPDFTGIENIYLYASLLGLKRQEIDARLDAILSFADIGDFTQQPVKTYSSGMAVRLAFAVVANVDADILIVDEALSVGDVFFVQKCMRFINKFKEENTLILVTHDTQAVLSVCTHGLVLAEGKMIKAKTSAKTAIEAYTDNFYRSKSKLSIQAGTEAVGDLPGEEDYSEAADVAIQQSLEHAEGLAIVQGNQPVETEVYASILQETVDHLLASGKTVHTALSEGNDTGGFGTFESSIIRISIANYDGTKSALIAEGEKVIVEIASECHSRITSPIIGFAIRNNNGLPIIGDNTFDAGHGIRLTCEKGDVITAQFVFTMPRLSPGKYSVHAAIARGTQDEHIQMHYFHEICAFEVVSLKPCLALACPSDISSEILVQKDRPF
jgi:lipopolysaccharide transport system ATP-binding protein